MEPIAAILAPDVEWSAIAGSPTRTVRDRDNVAARWRRLIDSALGARCSQRLIVSDLVDRIESAQRFVGRAPDMSDIGTLPAMTLAR